MKILYFTSAPGVPVHFHCPINKVKSYNDCYLGNGIGMCEFFVRYEHRSLHDCFTSCVVCKAKPIDSQLSLFD